MGDNIANKVMAINDLPISQEERRAMASELGRKAAESLRLGREACNKAGYHIGPFFEHPLYISNKMRKFTITVVCKNCFGSYERPWNDKERDEYEEFLKSLREPMTI